MIKKIINRSHLNLIVLIAFYCLSCYHSSYSQSNYWQKLYFAPSLYHISGTSICRSDANNYFILSDSHIPEGTIIYKINNYGDTIFTKYIPEVRGLCGISDNAGGIVFTGKACNNYELLSYLAKVNSNGQLVFLNSYAYSEPATCYDLMKSTDSNYIIGGRISRYGYIAKINDGGQFIWQKPFPASDFYYVFFITDGLDNGYLFAAIIKDSISYPYLMNGAVIKIDTSGNKIWEHRYFSQDSLQYFSYLKIIQHKDGYFLGGTHYDNTGFRSIIELIKINDIGAIKYRLPLTLSQLFSFSLSDMKLLSDNRILILYQKTSFPNNDTTGSGAIIIDTLGNIIANNEYTKNADYTALNSILYNPNSANILFTGTTDYNSVYERVLVVKTDSTLYAPPVSVNNISQTVPDNFYLYQNYPNPFNSATQIVFGIKKKGMYNLKIYDVTGKLISEIFNQSLEPGEYKTEIHADNLSSGVYFYRLESKIFSSTKKFVLLK